MEKNAVIKEGLTPKEHPDEKEAKHDPDKKLEDHVTTRLAETVRKECRQRLVDRVTGEMK